VLHAGSEERILMNLFFNRVSGREKRDQAEQALGWWCFTGSLDLFENVTALFDKEGAATISYLDF